MCGSDMPPPARGCLSAAKAGVAVTHGHVKTYYRITSTILPIISLSNSLLTLI